MAPYLATATNGVFELRVSKVGRIPLYHAVDPAEVPKGAFDRLARRGRGHHASSPALYGPYPFSSGGGIVDHAPEVGYALESQTKSQYDQTPDASTVVHEISHQWFGNSVSLDGLAGHLAQRGLRGLVRVDLRRAARRADRPAGVRRVVRPVGDELVLDPATGQRRRPGVSCSAPRSTTAAR